MQVKEIPLDQGIWGRGYIAAATVSKFLRD
jgi:hypothetical protein